MKRKMIVFYLSVQCTNDKDRIKGRFFLIHCIKKIFLTSQLRSVYTHLFYFTEDNILLFK